VVDANNPTGYAQVLEERVDGTPARTYTLGLDVVAQTNAAGGTSLTLLYDGHGSTRGLLDAAHAVVQRFAYDAYGNQLTGANLTGASAALTSLLYSGEQFDAKLATQYLRGRPAYDPATGRFSTADPIGGTFGPGDFGNANLYVYCAGNPVNLVDPTGLMSEGEAMVVSALIAGLATLTLHSVYSALSNATHASLSFARGRPAQGLTYMRDEVLDLLSLGLMRGPIDPEPLLAVQSSTQMVQVSARAAKDLAAESLAVYSSSIKTAGGHSYVSRPGSPEQDVPDAQGNPVRVVGQSGSSSGTDGHDALIEALKNRELQQPGRIAIFMQKSLRTVTGRQFASRLIPDVTVVRMEDGQIKIDMYEVQSQTQSAKELQMKLDGLRNLLPSSMQGKVQVYEPNSAP
jgi:RHS repeat-associated protein